MQRAVDELNVEFGTPSDGFIWWTFPRDQGRPAVRTVARLIAKHEQPPVDPILAAAREAVARWYEKRNDANNAEQVRDGNFDQSFGVRTAAAAINIYLEREASK